MRYFVSNKIGSISTYVEIGNNRLYATNIGENLWNDIKYDIRCSIYDTSKMEKNHEVDRSYYIVWNIDAKEDLEDINFITRLDPYGSVEVDNDNGENRSARYVTKDRFHLAIGTEDDEYLVDRIIYNDKMPNVLKRYFKEKGENKSVEYLSNYVAEDGIGEGVWIRQILSNESIEIRYAIAWKDGIQENWDFNVSTRSEPIVYRSIKEGIS